jgi:uncharacterized protein (DUF1501 family)
MNQSSHQHDGPVNGAGCDRRTWLGSTGLGGLATLYANVERTLAAAPTKPSRAKSVILIFNCGAPSHIDLFDPKPDAPEATRGKYLPIDTRVPGIQFSEMLPRMAQRADKLALIRSVYHKHSSHNSGMFWSIVGRPYAMDSTLINPSRTDVPSFGTLTNWLAQRDGYSGAVPPYVITPRPHCDSMLYLTPGQFGACLGPRFDPLVLNGDPNDDLFQVPNLGMATELTASRLQDRHALLQSLERRGAKIETPLIRDLEVNRDKALSIVLSGEAQRAFDLTQEPTAVRERYGRHTWGQSHLLARRLVEAGSKFVTTVNGPSIIWDTHKDHYNRLENVLVPPMEQAYAALLDDLEERGLLDTTLVVWMGDFGRTPQFNADGGRDHWPHCYTMVLAGGGIRGGQVIGRSDKIGGSPAERPIRPADVHATIFAALGYDSKSITYHLADGRPVMLSDGDVIRELL